MLKYCLLTLLSLSSLADASDLGFATHYHSWNSNDPEYNLGFTPFMIGPATPGTWVRSDIGWKDIETTQGTYNFSGTADDQWIKALQGAGQKVVALFNQYYNPTFYAATVAYTPDASGLSPATKFLVALAKQYPGIIIELGNEIQNKATTYWGTNWETGYVNWATEATNAIHAAAPGTQVIGYCAQGQQILDMLKAGGSIDGIVFHPYNSSLGAWPESTYEPPYNTDPDGFKNFVLAVQAFKKPIWITEQGQNGGMSEYACADWDVRRLVQSLWLKVDHIGFYQLLSSDSGQSVWTYDDYSRFCNSGINLTWDLLSGLTPDPNVISATSTDPNFNSSNFIGEEFTGQSDTVAVCWLGHNFWKGPYGGFQNIIAKANITAVRPNATGVMATDLVNGHSWPVQFTQSGGNVVIQGQVSQHPIAYTITSGGPSGPPRRHR